MKEFSASKFKAHCLEILGQVSVTGKSVQVSRYGKPLVKIVPPDAEVATKKRLLGSLSGKLKISGDIVAPIIPESDWNLLK